MRKEMRCGCLQKHGWVVIAFDQSIFPYPTGVFPFLFWLSYLFPSRPPVSYLGLKSLPVSSFTIPIPILPLHSPFFSASAANQLCTFYALSLWVSLVYATHESMI
ncbi:hypothetical protein BJX68DRAFT_153772 [Aspergillus pseudodeflectus]|uniref:Uncharacterized protein n=1 Tax=Aspergillus pseudodeflectus TaxID=176178 RepID=A0ABR4JUW1_9EURO